MAKQLETVVLDALLAKVADDGDKLVVLSGNPTSYNDADVTLKLAQHNLTVGDGNGDYTIADGSPNGRKLTLAQQAAITIDTTGTANHVAILDTVASKVLLVDTLTASQALTAANTVTVPAIVLTSKDPT